MKKEILKKKNSKYPKLSKIHWLLFIILAAILLALSKNSSDFFINIIIIVANTFFVFLCLKMAERINKNSIIAFWIAALFGIFGLIGYFVYFLFNIRK